MKILAVDDEKIMLESLTQAISEAEPNAEIKAFDKSTEALEEAKTFVPEIAFLDINIPGINGIELAVKLKAINPKINIIFVTAYSEYMGSAFSLRASGYLCKPVTSEDIKRELENLRNPIEIQHKHKLYVRTFGTFDIFYNDRPVKFSRTKSKELFAYLVTKRGASVNIRDVISTLWEDGDEAKSKAYVRLLVMDIRRTLGALGEKDAFIKTFNSFAVNTKAFDCDWYDFLRGDAYAINTYQNVFMEQYSWAEEINSTIYWKMN